MLPEPVPPRCIHLWVPGINETGGIQHYSWCLSAALHEMYPAARLVIFSRNDKAAHAPAIDGVVVHCFGSLPGRLGHLIFALAGCWAQIVHRPSLWFATHPAFARPQRWMRWLRTPCFVSAHGIEAWGDALQRLRRSLAAMTGVLPVSDFTRQVLIREGGLSQDRVIVVPDTFREHVFSPGPKPAALLERHGLRPDQPVLLTVGRLAAAEAYKGHDRVITALATLRASMPEVRYVIVGTGDDEPRLRALAAQTGQQEAVVFAGFVPDHELPAYYRLANAFVMPSTGEGFGIAYLEAIASGIPCIAGNRDASPEALDHGRFGILIDALDPAQLVQAMLTLLRREPGDPPLFDPLELHRGVCALYGMAAFKARLKQALGAWPDRTNA